MDKKSYPIGYVALITGLSPHVIRTWEKRYGAVLPKRTAKSRRLYSQEDIDHLILLKKARSKGQRIGTAVNLSEEDLFRIGGNGWQNEGPSKSKLARPENLADPSELLGTCLDAVQRMDASALDEELRHAGTHLSRPSLLSDVIAPLMQRVGDAWADGRLRIINEHLASNVVRGFLWDSLRGTQPQPYAPTMLITTPEGQFCEIGAMMAAITAADCGWNSVYLGPSLPAGEVAAAALNQRADAIALSVACPVRSDLLACELSALKQALGDGVALYVGGRAAFAYRHAVAAVGGRCLESLQEFREFLVQSGGNSGRDIVKQQRDLQPRQNGLMPSLQGADKEHE